MKSIRHLAGLVAVVGACVASAPVQALTLASTSCTAATVTDAQPGYVSCLGSFTGNMDNQLAGPDGIFAQIALAPPSGFGLSTTSYFSSASFASAGNPFLQDEGSLDDGAINFDTAQTGQFVLGLKQANFFSLYLFNGSSVLGGISQIRYDTAGVTSCSDCTALSHAGFFGSPTVMAPVPEPETYALMLAGLGVLGFVARRRRPTA